MFDAPRHGRELCTAVLCRLKDAERPKRRSHAERGNQEKPGKFEQALSSHVMKEE
jgi:hypothetical protein